MYTRLLRNSINLVLCLLGFAFCLALTSVMVLANYLACEVSFELLGYDGQPLYLDKLVGPFLGAFLNKATLTHLYAIVVALVVSIGLFMTCRILFRIFELIKDRNQHLSVGDQQSAKLTGQMILWDFVQLLAFMIPLAFVIKWDIELFRFRAIAGASSIENAELAAKLSNWGLQLQENGSVWAWSMTQIGAWGYIGITALGCLGLEYSMRKIAEHWARFSNSIEEILKPEVSQEANMDFYGYDQHGQPVYDPNTPIAYDVVGSPISQEGLPISAPESGADKGLSVNNPIRTVGSDQQTETIIPLQNEAQPRKHETAQENIGKAAAEQHSGDGPLFDSDQRDPERMSVNCSGSESQVETPIEDRTPDGGLSSTITGHALNEEVFQEVIGSPKGEKASLTGALARPESYWVDPDTNQIWDLNYREALLQGEKKLAA